MSQVALGGGIAYAAGGDAWQGATQGALGGALGGFTRGFFMNRFAQVCFVAGTPLVMDLDGNSEPIEEIQVGEFVLARSEFDPAGPLELKRVEELFTRTSEIVELELAGRVIGTTVEHPFFVPARDEFVAAKDLQVGDELISHDGRLIKLDAIRSTARVTTVYNMRVADHHTYFVGGRAWGFDVWVHNAVCKIDAKDVAAYVEQATKGKVDWASINPNLTSTQRSAIRAIAREQGLDIPTPNRFGKLGDPVSKRTGTYAARELVEQGYKVTRESNARIFTPQSASGKRYRDPDVFGINASTKQAMIVQVVRTIDKARITPHSREFDAMMDILNSPMYKKMVSDGYSVKAVMIPRGATSINPLREF